MMETLKSISIPEEDSLTAGELGQLFGIAGFCADNNALLEALSASYAAGYSAGRGAVPEWLRGLSAYQLRRIGLFVKGYTGGRCTL